MYSLKHGALPVARATGGIQEIIEDYDSTIDSGFGFLCYEKTPDAFWDSMKRARDFSWSEAAARYEGIY
jgi:starch synthase